MKWLAHFKSKPLDALLIGLVLAIMAKLFGWDPLWVFIFSAAGLIPLAGYIGEATESLAVFTGPRIGGLLNATLGNAAELIITLVAIRAGLLDLVKASITGSIIGNLLLVLGFAILLGGLKNGMQKFDRRQAGNNAIMLVMAVLALVIPSMFSHSIGGETSPQVEALSLGVAGVMIVLYALGIIYSLKNNDSPITYSSQEKKPHKAGWSLRTSFIVLAAATLGVVISSEMLVGAVEVVVEKVGLSEFFLGIILIPVIGNVAEHLVAVQVAMKNQMDLSVEVAVSSSLQIALFVAPLLVFVSLAMGNPLTLIFNTFELLALGAAVLTAVLVSLDGESNWLEGAALLAVYLVLGIAFFLCYHC
ncbi:MAG TPA: calcium/proton exchanger [Anaerolineaceae bacterium]|nr:calcium/proton exchanger [Anaerolineaceae bacterium]HPN52514.1 calcium/proton exchanger [Anaerolineaceae bacterium]